MKFCKDSFVLIFRLVIQLLSCISLLGILLLLRSPHDLPSVNGGNNPEQTSSSFSEDAPVLTGASLVNKGPAQTLFYCARCLLPRPNHATTSTFIAILLFSAEQPVPLKFRTFILAIYIPAIFSQDCSTMMAGKAEFLVATFGPRDISPCQIILLQLVFQRYAVCMRHSEARVWRAGGVDDGKEFRPSLVEAKCADGFDGREK